MKFKAGDIVVVGNSVFEVVSEAFYHFSNIQRIFNETTSKI